MPVVSGPKFVKATLSLIIATGLVAPPAEADREFSEVDAKVARLRAMKSPATISKKSKEDQAIELVWRRPEVKEWLKLFPKGKSKLGGHAAATADHDKGDLYSVHVYEDFPDHTATLNWYSVNLKTGKITKRL
jgi:hypothetical protein